VIDRDGDALAHAPLARQVEALEAIVRTNAVACRALDRLPRLGLPSWYLGAGGITQTVWNHLHGLDPACLRSTTPEAIVAKGSLMTAISALLARPQPATESWRVALRGAVDALDALERPFARYDRGRFGGPTSRDRLITTTRTRFPDLW
jgi:uncharacterized protein DUF6058/nucleotidyltransferase-like protein